MNRKKIIIYLLVIILIAIGFRVFWLGKRGVYFPDETRYYRYTVEGCSVLRNGGLKDAIKFAGNTFTAKPAHTMLGIIWMNFFGAKAHSALGMNAFFGALTVLVIFIVTRKFYTETAALISALILALSPLHIYYSRSFMSHTDQTFFIMLAFYLYALPLIRKRGAVMLRFAGGFLLGTAFGIHPTTAIYIIAFFVYELLLLFIDRSRGLRSKIAAFTAFFTAFMIAPLTFLAFNRDYFNKFMWVMNEAKVVVAQRKSAPVPFILSRITPVYEGGVFMLLAVFASGYFIYRIVKHRKPLDLLILLQSLGMFFYWEFLSIHERFSRQIVAVIPFFAITIGVFIDGLRLKNLRIANIVKTALILVVIAGSSYSATMMLATTKNEYPKLEEFIKSQTSGVKITTSSEYFAGAKDVLMPSLKTGIAWLNEKSQICDAVKNEGLDLLIIYPGDWLYKPELRFKTPPVFTVKEPQYTYFAEFYEGLCFSNRLDLLKYRDNPFSYSIGVYKLSDSLKKEIIMQKAYIE